MKTKGNSIITLEEHLDKKYGEKGTPKRNKHDAGFEIFKLGVLLQTARLEKGLTQEEVADKVGTTKSYISKIENNVKEVRLSTLQKIVHKGLGGHLNVSIQL